MKTRWGQLDLTPWIVLGLMGLILILFVVYPIGRMLVYAFVAEGDPLTLGNMTLSNFTSFFASPLYKQAIWNSIWVSVSSAFFSCVIGVPLAYVLSRIDIPGTPLWMALAALPLISPPFVGSYAWIVLLGRRGMITHYVHEWFGVQLPSIYGPFGITLALTFSLYPLVFLAAQGAFSVADPYLEESAAVMGASWWHRTRTIALPLVLPVVGAGAIMVFMRAIGNFGVPALLGGEYYVLPTFIYFQITGFFNMNAASAISLISIAFSLGALFLMRWFTARQAAATVTASARAVRKITHPVARIVGLVYVVIVLGISTLPKLVVILASFSDTWAATPLPTKLGIANYERVLVHSLPALRNSLTLAGIATLICAVVGFLAAYAMVRRPFKGRFMIDIIVMTPFLLPGIVVGVALLSGFITGPLPLAGTAAILIIAFFVRRMPYVFRSSVASIEGLDRAMEEASTTMGGSWWYTFRRIVLPLTAPGLMAGAIISFTTLIGELSATMILYSPKYKTATVAIYEYLLESRMGPASAIGTLMILVVLAGIMLANKLLGERIGNLFRGA